MKNLKPISSEPVLYVLIAVLATGAALSIALTSDPRWMHWHFSRLGEGGHISSYIFNATLFVAGLVIAEFTRRLSRDLTIIGASRRVLDRTTRIAQWCLYGSAICLIGVALFPFDQFPIVHNIFGYSMTVLFAGMASFLVVSFPIFSWRFTVATYAFMLCLALMFGYYFMTGQRGLPLIYIEMLGIGFFFIWMIMLVRSIRIHNRPK